MARQKRLDKEARRRRRNVRAGRKGRFALKDVTDLICPECGATMDPVMTGIFMRLICPGCGRMIPEYS